MKHYSDEDLSRYLDADLGSDEHRRVTQHLDRCAQCREAIDDLATLRAAAGRMDELEPSEAVWLRIRERTGHGRPGPLRRRRPWPRLAWLVPPALAATAALVLLVSSPRPRVVAPLGTRPASIQPIPTATASVPGKPSSGVPQPRSVRAVPASSHRAFVVDRIDSVARTASGRVVLLKPGEVLREYLGGVQRAVNDAEQAIVENPRNPRVRLVYSSSRASQRQALMRLNGGGE